jgi:hypothetical protein
VLTVAAGLFWVAGFVRAGNRADYPEHQENGYDDNYCYGLTGVG